MRWFAWLNIIFLLAAMSGCGLFSGSDPYAYRHSKTGKPLVIPEGLVQPPNNPENDIPQPTQESTASIEELEQPPQIVSEVDLSELQKSNLAKKSTDSEATKELKPQQALSVTLLKDSDGDSMLNVKQKFDIVWPLVKPALEELGFNIDDASRGRELYAISKVLPELNADIDGKPIHPADKKPDVKEEYQIHVKEMGENTFLTVHNKFGQPDGSGLAEHLLLQIKDILENPKPINNG